MNAWAYDHTGNLMEQQPIAVGYEVDWKRRGVRGSYRAVVLAIEPTRVQIKLTRYSDNPRADLSESTPRWVKPVFIHIFPSN